MLRRIFRFISRIVLPKIIVVGIDIQNQQVSAVATSRNQNAQILVSGTYELPLGNDQNGDARNAAAVADTLAPLVAALPHSRWHSSHEPIFILSLPPKHLYTEAVIFPLMEDSDLEEAVRLKLQTSLPWPLEEAYVDWRKVKSENADETTVLISALSKNILDEYVNVFFSRGWTVGAAEFHLFSLVRFVVPEDASSFIFILIDEDGVEFSVYASRNILVHHLRPVPAQMELPSLLEDTVRQLGTYAEEHFGVNVEKIYLYDKVSWESTSRTLTNITGIPTQIFSPEPHLDLRLSVAYGASLRPYGEAESLINLMPVELGGSYQENLFFKTVRFWRNIYFLWACAFLLALAGTFFFLKNQESMKKKEIFSLTNARLQQLIQSSALVDRAAYFNSLVQTARNAEMRRTKIGEKLSPLLAQMDAQKIVLQSIQLTTNSEVTISAVAPTRESALIFRDNINQLHIFQKIEIPPAQLVNERALPLVLTFDFP